MSWPRASVAIGTDDPSLFHQSIRWAFLCGNPPWKQNSQKTCRQSIWDTRNLGLCCWRYRSPQQTGASYRVSECRVSFNNSSGTVGHQSCNSGCEMGRWAMDWTPSHELAFRNLIQPHNLSGGSLWFNLHVVELSYIRPFFTHLCTLVSSFYSRVLCLGKIQKGK